METLEEKFSKLSAMEIKDQFGLIYLCQMSCVLVGCHTGSIPAVGWYRETVIRADGSEWEGPYKTPQDALGDTTKH